ncbi:hypothetical protein [Jejuia pallidilutea]|uniref:Uncharacterized protein n=2 Tax=Jejuia pallidilutea TaxID=504487 RepID=A0A098LTI5_9FLAO|nr:hypothetical protein [Jejuia pallidilutea]GAL89704.1 hypothetical protein JCM19538_1766 [Jejuia pallidilutea]
MGKPTLSATFIVAASFFNVSFLENDNEDIDLSFVKLAFAQNGGESGHNDFVSGSKMGDVKIQVGTEYVYHTSITGATIASPVPIYENISCCVSSNSRTACNRASEDPRC